MTTVDGWVHGELLDKENVIRHFRYPCSHHATVEKIFEDIEKAGWLVLWWEDEYVASGTVGVDWGPF